MHVFAGVNDKLYNDTTAVQYMLLEMLLCFQKMDRIQTHSWVDITAKKKYVSAVRIILNNLFS